MALERRRMEKTLRSPSANMKTFLVVTTACSLLMLAALWLAIITGFLAAPFYLTGIFTVVFFLWYGVPRVRETKQEYRARQSKWALWLVVVPDSRSEKMAFGFSRAVGWSCIGLAAIAAYVLINTAVSR